MKVFFAGGGTGGHLYPGLAIARAIVRRAPDVRPFFIGAERGVERDVLPDAGFEYALLDLHPLYRSRFWSNWRTAASVGGAWRAVGRLIRDERPGVVVGTGGYASATALARALAARVPIVLQEQNSYPGMTTRLFSRWAREIYLGYAEAAPYLHPRAGAWVGETGNPITPPSDPRPDRAAARVRWGFPAHGGTVLLVFGGSQGARPINDAVAAWAGSLPDGVHVIWGTGRASYERYRHLESDRIRIRPYLAPIEEAYAAADLALTRAGALTLAELCAWGIPAVLVPLPTAAADHQTANARALEAAGAAVVIPQAGLDGTRVAHVVGALVANPDRLASLAAAAAARGRPNAAESIAERILTLLHINQHRT